MALRCGVFCATLVLLSGVANAATSGSATGGNGGDEQASKELLADTAFMRTTPAQPADSGAGFFRHLWDDVLRQGAAPFRMDEGDLLWLGGAAAVTAGLIALDEPFDNQVKGIKDDYPWIANTSEIITEFGGNYGIGAAAAFAGYSFLFNDPKGKETSAMLAEALITSGLWTRLGKFLTGRERPSNAYSEGHATGKWYGPLLQCNGNHRFGGPRFDAFPSGHTATVFAIATVFAEQYNQTLVVPVAVYSFATVVGISRTLEHTHWISDVFVGALLGYLCGRDVVASYRPSPPASSSGPAQGGIQWRLSPFLTDQSAGVSFTLSVNSLVR
ncbi:MAG: phosphoesterase PA-phosphatase-like protein [Chlorobi bacterium OLB7]|nr:MAG: phosphoesterase PA-phosphatase-like protein [Chlorobi bacterium OLB7]